MDEFEKRLTAVHTRGLENVESPEMEEGGSAENVPQTPQPARGRARSTRGKSRCKHSVEVFTSIRPFVWSEIPLMIGEEFGHLPLTAVHRGLNPVPSGWGGWSPLAAALYILPQSHESDIFPTSPQNLNVSPSSQVNPNRRF